MLIESDSANRSFQGFELVLLGQPVRSSQQFTEKPSTKLSVDYRLV